MEYQRLVELYECLSKTTKRLAKTHLLSVFLSETTKEDIPRLVLLLQGKVFPDWDERETGVASRLVMKAMSTATGISAEQIEQEWKTIGDLGEVALKVCSGKRQSTLFSSELTIKKVFDNLRKLATLEGAGTVNNKMQLIAELLTSAKPLEAKYIVRTVLKDLRVGVGEGSVRSPRTDLRSQYGGHTPLDSEERCQTHHFCRGCTPGTWRCDTREECKFLFL